jgi:uncharacterized membrane protein (UPF0127 family)
MTKKILLAVAAIIVLVIAVVFVQALLRNNFSIFAKTASLKVADKTYNLEIADTEEKRTKGLSERKSMPENRGMMFTFEKPDYYGFWMKGMEFPIDIIFLDGNKVTTFYTDVPPPTDGSEDLMLYQPDAPSNRVIELNAGEAEKANIKPGQTLDIAL